MPVVKKTKFIFIILAFAALLFAQPVFAQTPQPKTGSEADANCSRFFDWFNIKQEKGDVNTVGNLPQVCTAQDAIAWVINLLLLLAGSVAVIFIMVGGFRYLTSAGNEEAAEKGKKTLITSVIGLAAIVLAAAIVRVVASTLGIGTAKTNNSGSSIQSRPPAV